MKLVICQFDTLAYHQFLDLRIEVFCHEQGIPLELEREHESECLYFLAYQEDELLGGARLRGKKIERLAVKKKHRSLGYGTFILRSIINYRKGDLYLHAQIQTIDYYTKLGFIPVGEMFEEAGIQHQKMVLLVDENCSVSS